MKKLYELKKGDKLITYNNEVIEFYEIKGDKAIFYDEYGKEFIFEDFLYIDEIGNFFKESLLSEDNFTQSLF